MFDCKVCGMDDSKKPMCFRGEHWCSEDHRKKYDTKILTALTVSEFAKANRAAAAKLTVK